LYLDVTLLTHFPLRCNFIFENVTRWKLPFVVVVVVVVVDVVVVVVRQKLDVQKKRS
jgi:hypothetical protein